MISTTHPKLRGVFRALIRYFFSEWDYNGHLGGRSIIELLLQENEILRTDHLDEASKLELDEAVALLTTPGYEENGTPISLYAGYHEGDQLAPLTAIKNSFSDELDAIGTRLEEVNDFALEDEVTSLITGLLPNVRRTIARGTSKFRARIGYEKHAISIEGAWEAKLHYAGYSGLSMGAPKPAKASAGRMNREGVAFLYLASNRATAIAEIRPYTHQMITTAAFEAVGDLVTADFHQLDIAGFAVSDRALGQFTLLHSVGTSFTRPVAPEYRHRYRFTQLLAECIRRLGFEAIAFTSGLSDGFNISVFSPERFRFVEGSSVVHRVISVNYKEQPLPVFQAKGHYFAEIRPE